MATRNATFVVATFMSALVLMSEPISAREIGRQGQGRSAKISMGSPVSITDFPFTVQLVITRGQWLVKCGGSLIRANIVLTAAHCMKELPATLPSASGEYAITVVAGESRWDGRGANSQRREAKKIRKHPSYNDETMENDVAIILVSEPFQINGNVKVVSLPTSGQSFSGNAQAAGWGGLNVRESRDHGSNSVLRKVEFPLQPDLTCSTFYRYSNYTYVSPGNICAGGDSRDTCQGDSGGPLICSANSQKYLCGVTSWGSGCGQANAPGVYARVSAYLPWIENQIQELTQCGADQFQCPGNGKCIPRRYVCDGDNDCGNGSDEVGCGASGSGTTTTARTPRAIPSAPGCSTSQFKCTGTQTCIPRSFVCDGDNDCLDRSDEANCRDTTPTTPAPALASLVCSADQFKCVGVNKCVPRRFVCDGDNDCGNGSDEQNCSRQPTTIVTTPVPPACPLGRFQCAGNGKCISRLFVCDGDDDCENGADEQNCGGGTGSGGSTFFSTTTTGGHSCSWDEFKCVGISKCIPRRYVCDGDNDCGNHSDEMGCIAGGHQSRQQQPQRIVISQGGSTVQFSNLALGGDVRIGSVNSVNVDSDDSFSFDF